MRPGPRSRTSCWRRSGSGCTKGFDVKLPRSLFRPVDFPAAVREDVLIEDRRVDLAVQTHALRITPVAVWYGADVHTRIAAEGATRPSAGAVTGSVTATPSGRARRCRGSGPTAPASSPAPGPGGGVGGGVASRWRELRLGGYRPARSLAPGELYSPRERLFLDCYPSNPRGYFDIDLRRADVRGALPARKAWRGVDQVAARAPFAVEFRYNTPLLPRAGADDPRPRGSSASSCSATRSRKARGSRRPTPPRGGSRRCSTPPASGAGKSSTARAAERTSRPSTRCSRRCCPYEPDVVVHAMVLNDAERPPDLEARRGPIDDWILDRRRLLEGEASAPPERDLLPAGGVRGRPRPDLARRPRDHALVPGPLRAGRTEQGWARTQEAMRDMDRQLRERGGRLVVASWPLLVDLDAYPFAAADETIARFCAAAGIPRVDLLAALQGRTAESLWVHPVDRHPNEIAHRLAAQALAGPVRAMALR